MFSDQIKHFKILVLVLKYTGLISSSLLRSKSAELCYVMYIHYRKDTAGLSHSTHQQLSVYEARAHL